MELLSVQVGLPKNIDWQGRTFFTAIHKTPVEGPVFVHGTHIEGDRAGDTKHHGGEFKAVYALGYDVYPWFYKRLGVKSLEMGAFGENLTVDTLDETEMRIGDEVQIGGCRLQAIQPRFPCSRLNLKFDNPQMVKIYTEGGRPGVYFRVLEEGEIEKGDAVEFIHRDERKVPVQMLWDLVQEKPIPRKQLENALTIPILLDDWRVAVQERLHSATR